MAVVLRLKRFGRKNRPTYRICAMDRRTRRDGRAIEELGSYDPNIANTDGAEPSYKLNEERAKYWLSQGAQVSETVSSFLKSSGIDIVTARKG